MPAMPFVTRDTDPPLEFWGDAADPVVTWRTLLSADRTPSSGLTMGVAEVMGRVGGEARLHRHAQAEAYYVLSGRGVLHLDGAEHALSAGSTAFIPGDAWHAAVGVGPEPLRLLYIFAADSFAEVVYEFRED